MNFLTFGGVLRWPAYLRSQDTYRIRYPRLYSKYILNYILGYILDISLNNLE
jgi:hypothetical protein